MRSLSEAAELRATPVIGAYLLWHFVKGYRMERKASPHLVLLFVALAILTDEKLSSHVGSHRNLSCFRRSMVVKKESDVFATLTRTVRKKLKYTTAALDIAVGAHLLGWNADEATIKDFPDTAAMSEKDVLSGHVLRMATKARRLGKLFAKCGDGPSVIIELGVKL